MNSIFRFMAICTCCISILSLTGCDTVNRVVDAVQEALTPPVVTVAQNSSKKEPASATTTATTTRTADGVGTTSTIEPVESSGTGTMPTPRSLVVGELGESKSANGKLYREFELTYIFDNFNIVEMVPIYEDGSGFAVGSTPEVVLKDGYTTQQYLEFCKDVPAYKNVTLEAIEGDSYFMIGSTAHAYDQLIVSNDSPESARNFALLLADAYQMSIAFGG